jgi:hypothetical protein
MGSATTLLAGRSRDRSPVVSLGVFSVASDNSMCPGSTQPLKNEYQDTPRSKDGRCVRLTTYHLQVPMSRNLEALTSQNPLGPVGLNGNAFNGQYVS